MGCLIGCFGFKKKKKRRKPTYKYLSIEQNHGSYVPLDSDVTTKLKFAENSTHLDTVELKGKKLTNPTKIKKKVSFNLNVEVYEPIPYDDDRNYFSEGHKTSLDYEEDLIESDVRNYRYQNCIEDEEDQFINDEYDFSFEEDDDVDDDDYDNDEEDFYSDIQEDGYIDSRAGGKSGNLYSELNPVENLAQWKKVIARKRKAPPTQYQKENKDLNTELDSSKCLVLKNIEDREISVDASLSNWIK